MEFEQQSIQLSNINNYEYFIVLLLKSRMLCDW